jgi:KUP system potassium uptake protein
MKPWFLRFGHLELFMDLATSPLYVYPSISCAQTPNEDDYLGMFSIIFWTLTLIGVIKYSLIVMYNDDHGEGDFCYSK